MRNWYTLPFTLLFVFSTQFLLAQESAHVEWSVTTSRYPVEVQVGKTNIHICNLEPGGTYSIIATEGFNGEHPVFEWQVRSMLHNQFDPQYPEQIIISPDEACASLELKTFVGNRMGTIPVYLSINRTDDTKPEPEGPITDQPELANLSTTGGTSASTLISSVLIGGNCFDVSNVTAGGNASSRGTFANGGSNIGIDQGVVLCTGAVSILPGPNNSGSANGGYALTPTPDPDLAALAGGGTLYDLSKIEFDFRPTSPTLSFDFVFGSEEYCEFVDGGFNDVFGFFISGPGIPGTQNIAVIPSTTTPVSIDNVSHVTNSTYFVGNSNSCGFPPTNNAECQLDGWTSVFTAVANVIPCSTYHIKLAIADVGDAAYASAVFLRANSFDAGGVANANPQYPTSAQFVIEGCNQGYIRIVRGSGDINQDVVVNFTVSGTATPGVDYDAIASPIIIPAGQQYILLPINVIPDLITEGNETVILLLSNACSCTQTQVTFNIHDLEPMLVTLNDVNGCGSTNTVLSPSVSGAQAPLMYQWSNGASSSTLNVAAVGTNTYTVTVTDACGRTSSAEATVTLAPTPTAALSGSGVFCVGASGTVNLNLNLTGQPDWTVTYLAAGVPTTQTFSSSPATITATQGGAYSLVSVVSSNGCPGTVSGNVNLPTVNVNLNLTPTNPSCFGLTNGSITSTPSGGTAPYTYSWTPSGSGANPTNLAPGTYTVTVTSSQGCTEEATVTLVEPPLLEAMINPPATISCSTPTASLDLTVTGGTPNYNYTWTGGSSAQDPNVTTGGTYTVTVRDARNCTTTATVTVSANNTLPTAAIAPPAVLNCNVQSLTLDASGSSQGAEFQYNWSGPGITCCGTTLQPDINAGGTYILTVTNTDNGCTKTVSVTVANNNTPPAANATSPFNIGCNHPTVTLSGAGSATGAGITYQWSTSDGNIQSGATNLNPVVNQAGTYTIVVTNNNTGCTAEDNVTITGDTQVPTAVVAPAGPVDCFNPSLQLNGTGSSQGPPGFTYNWTGGPISSGGNTLTPTITAGGTFTLVVTNPGNSCTATATVTVAANLTQPTAVATAPNGINCQNSTVTLNGTGSSTGPNFSYQWNTTNGNILSGDMTLNPVVNQGGTYTLVVTNEVNGCTRQVSVNVTQDQSVPIASAGPDRVLNCYTPTLQLQGTGSTGPGYTLSWTASPGGFSAGQNTMTPTVNQPGTYTLVITNTNTGCTSSDVVVVTSDFAPPVAQIVPPDVITCSLPNVVLDGGPSSTGPTVQYTWTGIAGGQIVGNNDQITAMAGNAGTYRLVVRNGDNGCTAQAQVSVTANTVHPLAEAGPGANITCQNPVVSLNGAGSSTGGIYTYQWTTASGEILTGATTLTPTVDLPGIYTLVVTNTVNGCTTQDNVNVTTNQNLPVAAAGPDLQRTCTVGTLTINGSNSTIGPGVVYQWTANPGHIVSGATTMTPIINQAGVYTLQITNNNTGCTDTDEVIVTDNIVNPVPVIATPLQITCFTPSVGLDASGSTDLGTPVFHWATTNGNIDNGGSTATPQVIAPGLYTLTITNTQNSCSATAQVTVTQDVTPPQAAASVNSILSCQNAQVQLSGAGSSTGTDFQYQWSTAVGNVVTGGQTLAPTVDLGGAYTLTVSNTVNGCKDTASVTVVSSQEFPLVNPGPQQTLTCAIDELVLDGSASSQGNNFAYIWDSPDGHIVQDANTLHPTVDMPGTYNLSIVNQVNGCTATASVLVGTDYVAPNAAVAPGGILSCTVSSVPLDGTGSSTGAQYSYQWQTQNGNILSGDTTLQPVVNAVGAYSLVITNNSNGCTSIAGTSVLADASLPVANAGAPDTLTCTVNSITLNALASSQGAGYAYTWSGPGTISTYTGLQPVVTLAGDYALIVTNQNNGCTALSTVSIEEDRINPVAEAGATDELTCVKTTISLDGTGSSTGSLYQYAWTALNGGQITLGANTLNPTVNEPGLYRLQITNSFNGCVTTDSVAITEDIAHPTIDAGPTSTLTCVIPAVSLAGQGSTGPLFVYDWTTSDGNIASGDSTLTPVVDAPGTYSLVVTNTYNGCTSSDAVTIDRDANVPIADAQVTGELNCVVTSLQLSGTNSSQGQTLVYTWNTPDGNILSGDSTLTPVIDEPGQYTLQVFNTANSCVAQSTVTVAENLVHPLAEAGNPQVLSCAHPQLTLDGTGSSTGNQYVYQWNTGDGNILLGDTTLQPQVDQSGFYTLQVTDQSNGCISESTVQILLDQNTPEANPGPGPLLTCAVTSVALDGTASSTGAQFSYHWVTSDGQIVSGDSTLTPVITEPGTYSLVVTNVNNGCLSTDDVVVLENVEPPAAAAGFESTLTCTTTATDLNIDGSSVGTEFSYEWTTSGGLILSGSDTPVPTVGDPGLYQLLVTNNNTGCTNTASVQVPEDVTPPAAATAVSGELTCSVTTLPLSSTGSSSGAQYNYLWTTSTGHIVSDNTLPTPIVDDAGTYQLLVTNNVNGCTSTASVTVDQNVTPPQVNASVNSLLTCAVTQIQLQGTATGGAQGVSYSWSGPGIVSGGTGTTPTVDSVGQYLLTATDLYNGCVASDPVTVSADVTPPAIAIATPAQLNCYVPQTVISGSGSTGGQYTYAWTGGGIVSGGTTLTPTINQPGSYTLLITNNLNGCTSSQSTSVSQDIQPPVAQAGGAFELTCSVTQGSLNTAGSTSGAGINYIWSTTGGYIVSGGNTATPLVNQPGTYLLTVVNAQTGCTNTASVAVSENTNYPTSLTLSRVLPKCGGQPGSLVIETVNGGVGPYLYSIDGGNTFVTAAAFENLTPGTYPMVVQDVNGCEYAQSLTFPVPVEPQVSLNPDVTLVFGQDTKLTAALNIPLSQIDTIIWEPMESLTLTSKPNEVIAKPFKDTEYTVRIINIDGCEDVAKVIVRVQDPQIWAPNVFSPNNKDGKSDYFLIFAADQTINKIHSLQVYDRWGTMVFQRTDMLPNDEELGWDGSFRGKQLNPAVFVWWADIELADGSHIVLKGDVTVAD